MGENREENRKKSAEAMMRACRLCPRGCGVDRASGKTGYCGVPAELYVARAALHFWEEPCISGKEGSGTVFFAGCVLRCVYCQNFELARARAGRPVTEEELAEMFLDLQRQKANNINLVTPTQYTPQICTAVRLARMRGLKIPIVYNCGGYELPETLRLLEGTVDIYLTDFKYMESDSGKRYSGASDYPLRAKKALEEMVRQCPETVFDGRGMMQKGVIVRHLLLPGHVHEAERIVRYVHETYQDRVWLSLMNQYTPIHAETADGQQAYVLQQFPEIDRKVTKREYNALLDSALACGIEKAFMQEGETAKESFIPEFSGNGVRNADRRLSFSVGKEEDGFSVETFLHRRAGLSSRQIRRLKFREEGIRRNGKQVRTTALLTAGDQLEIRLSNAVRKKQKWLPPDVSVREKGLHILYEDEDVLAVEKPSGMVCHPSPGHFRDTLCNLAAAYLPGEALHIVGRLDKDTSGIVLFAKNQESAGILAKQREQKILKKTYLACVSGSFVEEEGVIDAPIGPVPGTLMKMQVCGEDEGGKPARTVYRVLGEKQAGFSGAVCIDKRIQADGMQEKTGEGTLLRVEIEHGRTHQIRVHMAYLGHPVLHDPLYGPGECRTDHPLCLHAWRLAFLQPFNGRKILVETEIPAWAEQVDLRNLL